MNQYIVITHPGVKPETFARFLKKAGFKVITNYELKNHFLVDLKNARLETLRKLPQVKDVYPADDRIDLKPIESMSAFGLTTNWGLNRIDQRGWETEWRAALAVPYQPTRTGKGVDVYVVDTGCRLTHTDLVGRVAVVYDAYKPAGHPEYGMDKNGHGTHVASTVAGTKFGVAKGASVLVAKVFDGAGGTLQAVINGINACVSHHKQKLSCGNTRPSVMNLSLGGGAHPAQEAAVQAAINAGIVVVAAAGNDGMDLGRPGYDVMPAEIAKAITVGATNVFDAQAEFSNYGHMVDVFAPGQDIVAAAYHSDFGTLSLSGTSMACPHVAGVVALHLEGKKILRSADEVKEVHDWIVNNSSPDLIALMDHAQKVQTPNRMVFAEYVQQPRTIRVLGTPTAQPTKGFWQRLIGLFFKL